MGWINESIKYQKSEAVKIQLLFSATYLCETRFSVLRLIRLYNIVEHENGINIVSYTMNKNSLTFLLVQTLLPVTFGYSLSSEAVVMRQLRRTRFKLIKMTGCNMVPECQS